MSEPTVEEVREALKLWDEGWHPVSTEQDTKLMVKAFAAARLWVDAAEPDMGAAIDAANIDSDDFHGMDDYARSIIAAAFGDNNLIRRTE